MVLAKNTKSILNRRKTEELRVLAFVKRVEEKEEMDKIRKPSFTPGTGGFYSKPGPGRANENYEKQQINALQIFMFRTIKTLQKTRKFSVSFIYINKIFSKS